MKQVRVVVWFMGMLGIITGTAILVYGLQWESAAALVAGWMIMAAAAWGLVRGLRGLRYRPPGPPGTSS